MRRVVEFDDAELGQFEPKTQEALMRLLRQQESRPEPKPKTSPIDGIKWPDHKAEERRLAKQYVRDEVKLPINLIPGLRPKE